MTLTLRYSVHRPVTLQLPDGSTYGSWRVVFNGMGPVRIEDHVIGLHPKSSERPDETHAALIVSRAAYTDVEYEARVYTHRQLRDAAPNPWEVAWLVWSYSDPTHFYYLALKPNGWEVGKADPAYQGAQRFLATGPTAYAVGTWHEVHVSQEGPTFSVTVDGQPLATVTDAERPYLRGAIGLYTEDAEVSFADVEARSQ
jgi:hypothetical protein